MILGGDEADTIVYELSGLDLQKDIALSALYEYDHKGRFEYNPSKKGSKGNSNPSVARWLGDIQEYFPNRVVEIMQKDAMSHPMLHHQMILEPEILANAQPTVDLVAHLMQLGKLIPSKTKDTARRMIQKVVDELIDKLESELRESITGAINRSVPNYRPKYNEIDWKKTITKNLRHYQKEYKTVIPERVYGFGHKNKKNLKDIIICLDQSASMGNSIVYSAIFGSVMASLPTVSTKLVAFDTDIQDLSQDLQDPVDLLFGVQLGGGTDINKALGYCQNIIHKPNDTILILISDMYEGGSVTQMLQKIKTLTSQGVQIITLLALDDKGVPSYDKRIAKNVASFGIPVFACTPDAFADLMATAINQGDIATWAAKKDFTVVT